MTSSYVPVNWSQKTLLSELNFQNMETIYERSIEEIDSHEHPTKHYTKDGMDAKFGYTGKEAFLDADKVDGSHLAALLSVNLPIGVMLAYDGPAEDFSDGCLIANEDWHLCDGGTYFSVVTPDMRGYFPRCPTVAATTGTGGGAGPLSLTGTATVGDHALTTNEIPAHTHGWPDLYGTGSTTTSGFGYTAMLNTYTSTNRTGDTTGSGSNHNHAAKALTFDPLDINPVWMGQYFIMRVK
jgi:hypothetical protein